MDDFQLTVNKYCCQDREFAQEIARWLEFGRIDRFVQAYRLWQLGHSLRTAFGMTEKT